MVKESALVVIIGPVVGEYRCAVARDMLAFGSAHGRVVVHLTPFCLYELRFENNHPRRNTAPVRM